MVGDGSLMVRFLFSKDQLADIFYKASFFFSVFYALNQSQRSSSMVKLAGEC